MLLYNIIIITAKRVRHIYTDPSDNYVYRLRVRRLSEIPRNI